MGYTTDFTGKFKISKDGFNPTINAFLNNEDPAAPLILADWLEERGYFISEKIRANPEKAYALLHGMNPDQIAYIKQFNETRRMARNPKIAETLPDPIRKAVSLPIGIESEFFVGGTGWAGQDHDASIIDYNREPKTQPSLWCQWTTNDDGTTIEWDEGEKFYNYVEWLNYIIKNFLKPWGYTLNGEVKWQGERDSDKGTLSVKDNVVTATADPVDEGEEEQDE